MNELRIMVIDDENIVERLKEAEFHMVITDLKMKDIDGMEVLNTIKEEYPQIKVIMITAFASMDTAVEAFRKSVDDFFAKPIKIADLKATVKRLLTTT